jgi:hypothetical protein
MVATLPQPNTDTILGDRRTLMALEWLKDAGKTFADDELARKAEAERKAQLADALAKNAGSFWKQVSDRAELCVATFNETSGASKMQATSTSAVNSQDGVNVTVYRCEVLLKTRVQTATLTFQMAGTTFTVAHSVSQNLQPYLFALGDRGELVLVNEFQAYTAEEVVDHEIGDLVTTQIFKLESNG